jgi:DnaK suppressor protein
MYRMNPDTVEKQRKARFWLKARDTELRERLTRVERDLRRETTPLPADSPDAAIVVENDEILEAILKTGRAELTHVDAALERLEQGLYGICEGCGAEIDAARLAAVPYATHCTRCAR